MASDYHTELACASPQWRCLHGDDEVGTAFAFRMLRPDSEAHVSWDSLSAATAACLRLATGQDPPEECVQGLVLGWVFHAQITACASSDDLLML